METEATKIIDQAVNAMAHREGKYLTFFLAAEEYGISILSSRAAGLKMMQKRPMDGPGAMSLPSAAGLKLPLRKRILIVIRRLPPFPIEIRGSAPDPPDIHNIYT